MVEELPVLEADETDDEATAEISPEVDDRRLDKKSASDRSYASKPLEELTAVDATQLCAREPEGAQSSSLREAHRVKL